MNSYLKLLLSTPPLFLHLLFSPFFCADLQTFCHRTLLPACQFDAEAWGCRLSCRVRWPELKERGNRSKRVAVAFWFQMSESRLLSPFSQHTKRFKPTSLDAAALVPSLQPQSRLYFWFFKVRHLTICSYCVVSCYNLLYHPRTCGPSWGTARLWSAISSQSIGSTMSHVLASSFPRNLQPPVAVEKKNWTHACADLNWTSQAGWVINQPPKRVKVTPSLLGNTDKIRKFSGISPRLCMAKAAAFVSSDTKYSHSWPASVRT